MLSTQYQKLSRLAVPKTWNTGARSIGTPGPRMRDAGPPYLPEIAARRQGAATGIMNGRTASALLPSCGPGSQGLDPYPTSGPDPPERASGPHILCPSLNKR
jgi:hypothetical protein